MSYIIVCCISLCIDVIEKLASSGYYTAAVEVLRRDERAMHLLGEPLRFQTLRLNDKHNRITTEHAEVNGIVILKFNSMSHNIRSLFLLVVEDLQAMYIHMLHSVMENGN